MKKLIALLSSSLLMTVIFAQTPEKMSYQAIIRNSNNELVTKQTIGMQISIIKNSIDGITVYSEVLTPETNSNGLISIQFGGGAGFDTISWNTGKYFIKTETDVTGGTNYSITGISQLLTVPYALHAKTADNLLGDFSITGDIDYGNKDKVLTINWINLIPVTIDWGSWTVMARAHDFGYSEKYHEWRVIMGDNSNVYIQEIVNMGNATGSAELRVSDGYVQGRWTGSIGGGAFCRFLIRHNKFN